MNTPVRSLPEDAAWLTDFCTEVISFPNARHDDQIDAPMQFLDWLGDRQTQAMMHRRDGYDPRRSINPCAWR